MLEQLKEEWKPIKGYEGLYLISNLGNVKSASRIRYKGGVLKERILKPRQRNKNGKNRYKYKLVALWKDGKRKDVSIHKLVAETFIPKIAGKNIINHIDGNPENNCVNNLEWCTPKENTHHAWESGLCKNSVKYGAKHKLSRKVALYDLEGNFIEKFDCIDEACRKYNLNKGNVQFVLHGKRKHCKGFVVKYCDNKLKSRR